MNQDFNTVTLNYTPPKALMSEGRVGFPVSVIFIRNNGKSYAVKFISSNYSEIYFIPISVAYLRKNNRQVVVEEKFFNKYFKIKQ